MKKTLGMLLLTIMVGLSFFTATPTANSGFFKDLDEENPFYEAITYLHQHGIIQGYSDQTFRPDQKINRAETLKILLLGSNISVPDTVTSGGFFDVPKDSWYARFVTKGKQIGIVKGNPDGSFAPERNVNLAEALKMIINTNGFSVDNEVEGPIFPDVPIDLWFAKYFSYAKDNHFFTIGDGAKIYPSQDMSRGYLADLMYRAIIHKKETQQDRKYASYYSDKFNGKGTASGDTFDNSKFTAAHRTLPFGTKVRVININNGESVIVTINDRGPYAEDKIIDLTTAAFETIGSLRSGILPVVIEVVDDSGEIQVAALPQNCNYPSDRETINNDFYDHFVLDAPLPTLFLKNEIFHIKGRILNNDEKNQVTATLFLNDKQIESFSTDILPDRTFSLPIFLEQEGNYNFTIIPGTSGSSKAHPIQILSQDCDKESYSNIGTTPSKVEIRTIENKLEISWAEKNDALTKIRISDGVEAQEFIINNRATKTTIPYDLFHNLSEGAGFVEIASARSSSNFSIDRDSAWNFFDRIPIIITKHHFELVKKEDINVLSFNYLHFDEGSIKLEAKVNTDVKTNATVILPSGFTSVYSLQSNTNAQTDQYEQQFFPSGSTINMDIPVLEKGTYIVGIYNTKGEAIFNYPSYNESETPLVPDFSDINHREYMEEDVDLENHRLELFELINRERENYGLKKVEIFDNLNELAQLRSEDMVQQDYFGHFTPSGEDVNTIRLLYNIKTPVRENIAKDVSIEFVHEMLMRSPRHRSVILSEHMTRVGMGIKKHADGTLVVTELFSEDPIELTDLTEKRSEILQSINEQRTAAGLSELTLSSILNPLAQQWSELMAKDDFCDGEADSGESLHEQIQNSSAQILGGISRFICHITFHDALDTTLTHESAMNVQFDTIGIGVVQDATGIIRFTIIFADEA